MIMQLELHERIKAMRTYLSATFTGRVVALRTVLAAPPSRRGLISTFKGCGAAACLRPRLPTRAPSCGLLARALGAAPQLSVRLLCHRAKVPHEEVTNKVRDADGDAALIRYRVYTANVLEHNRNVRRRNQDSNAA